MFRLPGAYATVLIYSIARSDPASMPEYQYELIEQIKRENEQLYSENLITNQDTNKETASSEEPKPDTFVKEEIEHVPDPLDDFFDEFFDTKTDVGDNIPPRDKSVMVMQVRHMAKLFNKRCLISYHCERLRRLKRLRWKYGAQLPKDISKNLSHGELNWFAKYNEYLLSYMSSLNDGKGIDLALYQTYPRKLYIQVKCLKDYGQFETEAGCVLLKKDTIHYFPILLCEKLIQQGVLEQVSL